MKKLFSLLLLLLPLTALAGAYEDMEEAMIRKDSASVIALLDRGMDVNTVSRTGDTLLIQAIRQEMPELVDKLLARHQPGDPIELHAFRRDELMRFEIRLDAPRPERLTLKAAPRANALRRGWLGA